MRYNECDSGFIGLRYGNDAGGKTLFDFEKERVGLHER
jgi:hypothetical protein